MGLMTRKSGTEPKKPDPPQLFIINYLLGGYEMEKKNVKNVQTETKNPDKAGKKHQDFSHIKGDVDDFIFSFTSLYLSSTSSG